MSEKQVFGDMERGQIMDGPVTSRTVGDTLQLCALREPLKTLFSKERSELMRTWSEKHSRGGCVWSILRKAKTTTKYQLGLTRVAQRVGRGPAQREVTAQFRSEHRLPYSNAHFSTESGVPCGRKCSWPCHLRWRFQVGACDSPADGDVGSGL